MNGYECGGCDCSPCRCKEIKEQKELKIRKECGDEAVELIKNFDEATNELHEVLMKPKGVRQRLLKWLFPELTKVADSLRKCYWYD